MKIVNNTIGFATFNWLKNGEVFLYENTPYMVIHNEETPCKNAVNLTTGELDGFSDNESVIVCSKTTLRI